MALPSYSDASLWLAILHELDLASGEAHRREIILRMRKYFPEITESDIELVDSQGLNQWDKTIQWAGSDLIRCACIDATERGLWRLTAEGKHWLDVNWRGWGVDYSTTNKPPSYTRPLLGTLDEKQSRNESRRPRSRSRSHSYQELVLGELIEKAVGQSDVDRVALEHYLLGVVAYELEIYDEAASLLDRALELSLQSTLRIKAEKLRDTCRALCEEIERNRRLDSIRIELTNLIGADDADAIIALVVDRMQAPAASSTRPRVRTTDIGTTESSRPS